MIYNEIDHTLTFFNITALYMAAGYGHVKTIKTLIELGKVDVNNAPKGRAPLHIAAQEGHCEVEEKTQLGPS